MLNQPFPDASGGRRRSLLLFCYFGAFFSALAVVLAGRVSALRTLLVAFAVLGAGTAIVCLLRFLRSNDEREQEINYRALTFAFAGTLVFSSVIGFMQMFGFHSVPWIGIPALMICLWSLGLILYSRRYR